MNRSFYAFHDSKQDGRGMFEVNEFEAFDLNKQGYGIFWTVNEFDGPRQIENLVRVISWAVDMDFGTKESMRERIRNGLPPSRVIETKRGYHVYWNAKDAVPEHYDGIMTEYLVPFYFADPKARDLARVLRAPGYKHMKDPADPFEIIIVHDLNNSYTEYDITKFFPRNFKNQKRNFSRVKNPIQSSDPFWVAVGKIDCEEALSRLSGTALVRSEVFTFKENRSGTKNIYVNGEGTSCWIDSKGHIGSLEKGGPTIAQWLHWYGLDYGTIARELRKMYPELP